MVMKLAQDNTSTKWQNQDSKPGSMFQESMHLTTIFTISHKNTSEVYRGTWDDKMKRQSVLLEV